MCGIVGYYPLNPSSEAGPKFAHLFEESRIRGMHAFGLAQPLALEEGFCFQQIRSTTRQPVQIEFDWTRPAVAHARYSQSGDWRRMENNQPIVVGHRALAHNGVIHMGTKDEYEAAYGVECDADNDSEIFLRVTEDGKVSPAEFIMAMSGSFAGVWLEGWQLWAGRNARRPLWRCDAFGGRWYASTADIFRRAGFPAATEVALGVESAATLIRMEIL